MREWELEDYARLQSRLVGLGAGAVTKAQALVRRKSGGTRDRQHDGELGLDFEITRMKLHAGLKHRHALPECPHANGQACSLEQVGKCG